MEELNISQFYEEFMASIKEEAQLEEISIEEALTTAIIEYVKEEDMANSPEICYSKSDDSTSNRFGVFKINAFDYSSDSHILDLFITQYYEKETLPNLTEAAIEKSISKLVRFFNLSIKGDIERLYKDTDPDIKDVGLLIREQYEKNEIETIRFFVLSNGIQKEPYSLDDTTIGEKNIPCEYYFWDLDLIRRSEMSGKQLTEINIDFKDKYQPQIECIKVQDENPYVNSYLAIMPAMSLAKIYSDYKTKLIDQNVRNFLGTKIKVNREISNTVAEKPEMFFAYNNGISSTASKVDIVRDDEGKTYITNLLNWHIVNGGQTTCTIYNVFKNNKYDKELLKTFVTMKVSEIKDKSQEEAIVSHIAQFANSQTKINASDLSANSKYLSDLDDISKREWTPYGTWNSSTLWYFERLRGQFNVERLNTGSPRSAKVKKFEKERPKRQRINKTDVAKLEMCWDEMPQEASKGGEVCFKHFWNKDYKNTEVTAEYFHNLIAKKIIYDKIDKLFKEAGNKGYGNIVRSYALAITSMKSKKMLDLKYIWQKQDIQPELIQPIKDCIEIIIDHIKQLSLDGKNPSVEAKKVDFWNAIKIKIANVSFPETTNLAAPEKEELTEEQIQQIENLKKVDVDVWKRLSIWGKKTRNMSILEKKKIDHVVSAIEKEAEINHTTASSCLKILRLAEEAGFTR